MYLRTWGNKAIYQGARRKPSYSSKLEPGENSPVAHSMILELAYIILESVTRLNYRFREMAQQLRALDTLPEDMGSIPSTYMLVHRHQ